MSLFTQKLFEIGCYIGFAGVVIGMILHFGTSKAERYGKVATDPKTAKRIKIGYYFISLIVVAPILCLLIGGIMYKIAK